jgi:hypothetical protein
VRLHCFYEKTIPYHPYNRVGKGNYRVEGLRFQMGGWWEVTFNISAAAQNDTVTFNLVLEG